MTSQFERRLDKRKNGTAVRVAPGKLRPRRGRGPGRKGKPQNWNVWCGGRLLGIVNEPNFKCALREAERVWREPIWLDVIEATLDPFRARTLVRPEFLLPNVTTRVQ